MQQFIPFEDDWDLLEQTPILRLIPYRIGLLPQNREDEEGVKNSFKPLHKIISSRYNSTPAQLERRTDEVSSKRCEETGIDG